MESERPSAIILGSRESRTRPPLALWPAHSSASARPGRYGAAFTRHLALLLGDSGYTKDCDYEGEMRAESPYLWAFVNWIAAQHITYTVAEFTRLVDLIELRIVPGGRHSAIFR